MTAFVCSHMQLERGIEKAGTRLSAREEADDMVNLAQKHMMTEGGDQKARQCLEQAKTCYERALEAEYSKKTSDLIAALDAVSFCMIVRLFFLSFLSHVLEEVRLCLDRSKSHWN